MPSGDDDEIAVRDEGIFRSITCRQWWAYQGANPEPADQEAYDSAAKSISIPTHASSGLHCSGSSLRRNSGLSLGPNEPTLVLGRTGSASVAYMP